MKISVCLCNLGLYNEGELACRWLDLPATDEEIAEALDAIRVCHDGVTYENGFGCPYEELFLCDWESSLDNLPIGEYTPLRSLNELVDELDSLDDDELEVLDALLGDSYDMKRALQIVTDHDYSFVEADDDYSLGYNDLAESGMLNEIPEWAQEYFDFQSYGESIAQDAIATKNGYLFVY